MKAYNLLKVDSEGRYSELVGLTSAKEVSFSPSKLKRFMWGFLSACRSVADRTKVRVLVNARVFNTAETSVVMGTDFWSSKVLGRPVYTKISTHLVMGRVVQVNIDSDLGHPMWKDLGKLTAKPETSGGSK